MKFSRSKKATIIGLISLALLISSCCTIARIFTPESLPAKCSAPSIQLEIFPSSLNFGMNKNSMVFNVQNSSENALNWSVVTDKPWINVSPVNGTSTASNSSTIIVDIQRRTLSVGSHNGTIRISSNAGTKTVAILVEKAPPLPPLEPILSVFPAALSYGFVDSSRIINITNVGEGILEWNISTNQNWLSVSQINGTTTNESDQIIISIDRNVVSDGTYNGRIQVSSNGGIKSIDISMQKKSDLTDINQAWVTLFEDKNFSARSYDINYPTSIRRLRDFNNFNDKVSSVRWHIPLGWKVILFDDHDYRDSQYPLIGTGKIEEIGDVGSFNDKASSIRWEKI